jgi:hypothetical protein
MSGPTISSPDLSTRDERIEALLRQLAPTVEAAVRRLVERAIDTPEHEEFGAIEVVFRDAGQDLANDVRQATLASRKKRGTSVPASRAPAASGSPSSIPTSGAAS